LDSLRDGLISDWLEAETGTCLLLSLFGLASSSKASLKNGYKKPTKKLAFCRLDPLCESDKKTTLFMHSIRRESKTALIRFSF
jgi:hypothetical protein